jgi:hypothetical protein
MGFTVVPFGQGFKDMSPPTKELMKLTLEQRIAHGGQPVLRWMMDNMARPGIEVRFADAPAFPPSPDPLGPGHEPWVDTLLPEATRRFPAGFGLSGTAQARLQAAAARTLPRGRSAPYRPKGLALYLTGDGTVRPDVTGE